MPRTPRTRKPASPHRARLKALRAELARAGVDGFIVPHADEHQSEFLPASAERLAWLTGFTGSAGTALVLANRAAIFVDGRYTLQVRQQVDTRDFRPENLMDGGPTRWLAENLKAGQRLGYDPWLVTVAGRKRLEAAVRAADAELVALPENPVDTIWTDRPAPPLAPVALHPARYAGEGAAKKLARLAAALAEKKRGAAILSDPASVAWAFNIRGADIAHMPVALAFAILRADGRPSLFIDGRKLSNAVRSNLEDLADIAGPAALATALAEAAKGGTPILIDPAATAAAIADIVASAGGKIVEGEDPVDLSRAVKNRTEIAGSRKAHLRDGVAMVRFLAWLDRTAARTRPDEIAVSNRLEEFRRETATANGSELVDLSFATISGAGPNGAIVHYHATETTKRRLQHGSLYLVDSGAQYRDGTTDITRTVPIGRPTPEMKRHFTLVLKGHIALATARFPAGTSGAQLDGIARDALWRAGLDYDHGTGHGVGSFLGVHEGPARISKTGGVALQPGMILSNEPGYYRTGAYGIRIENLVLVRPAEKVPGGERKMLGFETLTLCPIDRRLVVKKLLTAAEIAWLNAYHRTVRQALVPHLAGRDRAWLEKMTKVI